MRSPWGEPGRPPLRARGGAGQPREPDDVAGLPRVAGHPRAKPVRRHAGFVGQGRRTDGRCLSWPSAPLPRHERVGAPQLGVDSPAGSGARPPRSAPSNRGAGRRRRRRGRGVAGCGSTTPCMLPARTRWPRAARHADHVTHLRCRRHADQIRGGRVAYETGAAPVWRQPPCRAGGLRSRRQVAQCWPALKGVAATPGRSQQPPHLQPADGVARLQTS